VSHFKLFEEFNPFSSKELAVKLKLYADGSGNTRFTTPIKRNGEYYEFMIHTNDRSEFVDEGFKVYKVRVHCNKIEDLEVITYEGEAGNRKRVRTSSLEISGENDLEVILINYFEVTQIYDDTTVRILVDNCHKIKTQEDIDDLLKSQTPTK